MVYLDSHAHILSEEFEEDFDEMLKTCFERGVTRINIMCTEQDEARRAMKVVEQDPLHFTMPYGIFPTDVEKVTEELWDGFLEIAYDKRCACIGEIGLDYYWEKDETIRDKQKQLFIDQIKIANKVRKPICVHSRDAMQDTFDIMKEYPSKGLLHSFSGSLEMANEFIKRGYYISIGGPVTFKNSRHAVEVVQGIDKNFLLSGTDSPYMAPEPVRGTRNVPFNIPYIVQKMADVRNENVLDLAKTIDENWTRFLSQ